MHKNHYVYHVWNGVLTISFLVLFQLSNVQMVSFTLTRIHRSPVPEGTESKVFSSQEFLTFIISSALWMLGFDIRWTDISCMNCFFHSLFPDSPVFLISWAQDYFFTFRPCHWNVLSRWRNFFSFSRNWKKGGGSQLVQQRSYHWLVPLITWSLLSWWRFIHLSCFRALP